MGSGPPQVDCEHLLPRLGNLEMVTGTEVTCRTSLQIGLFGVGASWSISPGRPLKKETTLDDMV